jgi:acyl-CoA-binding protein
MPGILTGYDKRRFWKNWEGKKGMKREDAANEYIA